MISSSSQEKSAEACAVKIRIGFPFDSHFLDCKGRAITKISLTNSTENPGRFLVLVHSSPICKTYHTSISETALVMMMVGITKAEVNVLSLVSLV